MGGQGGIFEEETFEMTLEGKSGAKCVNVQGKEAFGRGANRCKGPVARTILVCLRNGKKTPAAGVSERWAEVTSFKDP